METQRSNYPNGCKSRPDLCTGHGNESISPHTRTLYPPGSVRAERALRREGKVPWRGTSLRLLRHFFSFSRVSLFVSQSRSYLSLPPSSESSRTRNSRSTVRTLNAQPCSHFRRAHTRADNAACRRLATSLLLLLIISTVVFLLSDHSHDKYFRKSRFSNGTNTHVSY